MFLLKRGEQEEEEEARGASPVNDAAEPEETARRWTEGWGGHPAGERNPNTV